MEKYNNTTNVYHVMASFYDELMSEKKYLYWKVLINEVINKYKISKKTCLDLACGTGNISKILMEEGFKIIGVDFSKEMISLAQKKIPKGKFICADLRNFELEKKDIKSISFAVSFYDSLNYLLSKKDLLNVFEKVSKNISSGSIFLFDLNSKEHVRVAQKFKPRIFEGKDFYSFFRFSGDRDIWILDIDFFVKNKKNNSYVLFKEKHYEKGYDEKSVKNLLKKSGFNLLEVKKEYKKYENGKNHLSRFYFIAQKI